MKIDISEQAAKWFENEMLLDKGDFVRFYVKYGGCSSVQEGFSLGISTDEPDEIAAISLYRGITYYIEERDKWYFDGHDLMIQYDPGLDEPSYIYNK